MDDNSASMADESSAADTSSEADITAEIKNGLCYIVCPTDIAIPEALVMSVAELGYRPNFQVTIPGDVKKSGTAPSGYVVELDLKNILTHVSVSVPQGNRIVSMVRLTNFIPKDAVLNSGGTEVGLTNAAMFQPTPESSLEPEQGSAQGQGMDVSVTPERGLVTSSPIPTKNGDSDLTSLDTSVEIVEASQKSDTSL